MTPNPVPVERFEAGYKPTYIWRTEDCYIWHNAKPGMPRSIVDVEGGPWILRVNETFSGHRTLYEARIEASRRLGVEPPGPKIQTFTVTIDPSRYYDGGKSAIENIKACATTVKRLRE